MCSSRTFPTLSLCSSPVTCKAACASGHEYAKLICYNTEHAHQAAGPKQHWNRKSVVAKQERWDRSVGHRRLRWCRTTTAGRAGTSQSQRPPAWMRQTRGPQTRSAPADKIKASHHQYFAAECPPSGCPLLPTWCVGAAAR